MNHWQSMSKSPRLTRFCVTRLGIPESDLRGFRWVTNYDIMIVRMWNGRRLTVTGPELHRP